MSTLTREDLAAYFVSVGLADVDVDAAHGKCPNCYHDGAAYRWVNDDGVVDVDCSNCTAQIGEFVLERLQGGYELIGDTAPPDWLQGTPVDPLAEPPEPLPAVPGIPFAYHPASILITGPTGSGRSALIEALLYDAVRTGGLRAAYLSGEVTEGEANARAGDLADRRGDPVDDALRGELVNLRYLDLAPTIERAWQDPLTWADEMQRLYPIVAIDPLSTVASTLGLDFDKSNSDYVDYFDRLIKPLTDRGMLVLQVDNIGHALEAKARAKGASAKQDKADVVLACKLRAAPTGLIVTARKVRSVRAPFKRGDSWTFDRDTQRIDRDVDHQADDAATFRPTVLMERVSRAVEAEPGITRRALRDAAKGKHDTKMHALDVLIVEEYIEAREEGGWTKHYSARAYRENLDRSPGPQPVPNRSPGTTVDTGPPVPSVKDRGPGTTPPEPAADTPSMEPMPTPSGLPATRPDAKTCDHCGAALTAFGGRLTCIGCTTNGRQAA